MNEFLTEKEQLALARKWWDENGRFVISGLVLGAGILFGWNYYKNQKIVQAQNASMLHEALMEAVDGENLEAAEAAMSQLRSDYSGTPYAEQASLAIAKLHADAGDLDAAAVALDGALAARPQIATIARLRLARLRIAQDRAQEALDLLAPDQSDNFGPLVHEVRGDAHAALGDNAAALEAYQAALDSPATVLDRNFVQMKLDALGLGSPDE